MTKEGPEESRRYLWLIYDATCVIKSCGQNEPGVSAKGRRLAMLMKAELASDHKDGTIKELIVVVAFAVIGLAVSLGFIIAFQISSDSATLFTQLAE
jgi:hypothetical protein